MKKPTIMTSSSASVQTLVRDAKPGFTLPAALYNSPEMFALDLDIFFHRHWVLVCVTADVPKAGDVRMIEIGQSSVIVVRDDAGEVRVFHNVCRHRGARLVNGEKASVGRIVCPYHQWTYALTGDLMHAAHMGEGFDKSCHGLKPVSVRIICGLVYVCLADTAPDDIEDVADVLIQRLASYRLDDAKIAHETNIVEEGNWKLSIDNNRECYHCDGSHPELGNTLVSFDVGFDPDELSETERTEYEAHAEQGHRARRQWEQNGFVSGPAVRAFGCTTYLRTERFALQGAGESHTLDGAAACVLPLGAFSEMCLGDLHIHTHNAWMHVFADHAVISFIVPRAPGRTELRTVWLVNRDANAGVHYDLERLTEVWRATNQQDADLVAIAQKGVSSPAYEPGPLSPFCEAALNDNNRWYLERLKAHGVGS